MRRVRWTQHALKNLVEREIDRAQAEATIAAPEFAVEESPGRRVLMRRYFDEVLGQEMLLRVVVEETDRELIVVTLYKSSQLRRYLKGLEP